MADRTVILASGSPRRSELLARMGVSFFVDAADVDESYVGGPADTVLALARRKAEAVVARYPDHIVLAADTIVFCEGIMKKPTDEQDAARILRKLSGRWHEVYSGVCAMYKGVTHIGSDVTRVHFVPMSDEDIAHYIATGEPMGKAGAYGIQGMAGMFIDRVEGCPHNVMGLPLVLTRSLLDFKE